MSASGIAEALGDVSRSAVLGKLHRLRLLRSRQSASAPRRYRGAPTVPARASTTTPSRPPAPAPAPPPPLEPPPSPWREEAFEPLPGGAPRNWLTRAFGECAFPVGGEGDGLLSCCAPVRGRSVYCPAHHAIAFQSTTPAVRAAAQRRWVEAAARWAA